MPDISLHMLGDASLAAGAFKDIGAAALATGKLIADFARESIKAFADSERGQRQFRIAAGESTRALNEQIDAMKEKYSVDDDEIRHMDTLLLRYGAAPSAIKGATSAILDYSAATGKDATSAMEMLIRGVESGTGSLGKMGVHFKSTGDFAKDLAAAVEALGQKFGGAGEEDAKSLDGRSRRVGMAIDDVKKSIGSMFDEIEQRTGILDKLAKGIDSARMSAEKAAHGKEGSFLRWIIGGYEPGSSQEEFIKGSFGFDPNDPAWQKKLATAQDADRRGAELLAMLRKSGAIPPEQGPEYRPSGLSDVGATHAVGGDAAAKKAQDEFERQLNAENEFYEKRWLAMRRDEEQEKEHDEAILKSKRERAAMEMQLAEDDEKHDDDMLNAKRLISDLEVDNEFKTQEKLQRLREQADAKEAQRLKHQEEQWRQAGDRIGAALVNAIGAQLQRMAEGGDVDPAEMVGDVLSVVLSVAGFAIGSYFGSPQLGGAIGGLAGGLAKTGIVSEFGRKAGKKHAGGAIERYHGGGVLGLGPDEVPLIGQIGENMWSRNDVRNAGGTAAVEAMKRGGGRGLVVNVSAIDSRSFTDSMGREGGRGVFNALRVGRGDLVPLFSG